MINAENIKATGSFCLQVVESHTGRLLEQYTDHNLVVTLGRTNLAKLLGGNIAGLPVSKIAVGTGSTTPALTDTALTSPFSKAIDSVDYPDVNSVRFNWTLSTAEANGTTITEFGLLNAADSLFARKVRTPIVKTSAISLVGNWKITIN
jgi:hypothetical protein